MKPHVKIYFEKCEVCDRQAIDIHHIEGRGKEKDVIENLMSLCREYYTRAHKFILGKHFKKDS